ncbi:hypothetical protein SNEBB_010663, partial [Seison nebaliae]
MYAISDYPLYYYGFNDNFGYVQEPRKKRIPTALIFGLLMLLLVGAVIGGVIAAIYGSTSSSSSSNSATSASDTTVTGNSANVIANSLPIDCGVGRSAKSRIVNGNVVQPTSVPHIVTLFITKNGITGLCGGSIINEYWIVTAAHCLRNAVGDITVIAGNSDIDDPDTGEVTKKSAKTFTHSGFTTTQQRLVNDISLIKLSSPLTYTDRIAPVCLGTTKLGANNEVTVSGWGRTTEDGTGAPSNDLRSVEINTRTDATCSIPSSETTSQLCAGDPDENQDSCGGDSGGPLARQENGKWTLYGLTSYGLTTNCDGYGVYTNLPNYI